MSTRNLFSKPFSPKKAPPRKAVTIFPLQMDAAERSREFGLDYNNAHMNLGEQHFKFDLETGDWLDDITGQHYHYNLSQQSSGGNKMKVSSNSKEIQNLQKGNQHLQEENNLLKVKNEILVDMIAEVYSEFKLENDKKKKK